MENSNKELGEDKLASQTVQATNKTSFIEVLKKRKGLIAPGILIIVLLITFIYYSFKISSIEKHFSEEKQAYEQKFNDHLEKVTIENAAMLSQVFSWSVRSEILRDNKEQVGLLLNQFVKTNNVKSVAFINVSNIVEISTDKKREGNNYEDAANLSNAKGEIIDDKIIIPIFGINETLGYLEVNFQNLTQDFK